MFCLIEKDHPDDEPILIVLDPSGESIEVQAAGVSCYHYSVEGYIAEKWNLELDINECDYVCERGKIGREKELAAIINKELAETDHQYFRDMSFDYDRFGELVEGWWPVKGSMSDDGVNFKKFVGYIHQGNCD